MILNIRGTLQEYYKMLFFQLRAVPPFHTLRPRDTDILSHLMAIDYELQYNRLNERERNEVLFSYETKMMIMGVMNITDSHYRNIVQSLRTNGFVEGRTLSKRLDKLKKPQQITVNFTIQYDNGGNNGSTQDVHKADPAGAVPA